MGMNCRNVYIVIPVLMPLSAYSVCPDGTTAYLGPESNLYRNANGDCVELCGAGITSLNTSNGYRFDLFATKNTTPAINVRHGDTVCYADLIPGVSDGTLNVNYNDTTYHANPNSGQLCSASYTLSYSCGNGATGTPPESQTVWYKLSYTGPYSAGTCNKPGYFFSGWKIDSTSISKGGSYSYTYTSDKTMVAQWLANEYGGAYICDNGTTVSSYVNATFGGTVTPSTTVCTAADGMTFAGYRVLDALGNDTGAVISPGSSWTWTVPGNIRLVAIWN